MLKFSVGQKIHAYGVLSTLNFVEVLISHKYEIFFLKMEEILFPVIVKVIKSFQALISVSVKEYNCFPFAAFLVCQCVFVSCQSVCLPALCACIYWHRTRTNLESVIY